MADGVGAFREAFERYVNAASAKQAKPVDKKKAAAKKKTPVKKAAAKKKAVEKSEADTADDFNALMQSDCWQEMSMLKDSEPDIWKDESGGQVPRTIPTCIDLVDRINARLEASGDIPG